MMRSSLFFLIPLVSLAAGSQDQKPPLKQIENWRLSSDVKGHFDHFGVDLTGHRLFITPEDYHAVLVYDLKNGKLIHKIGDIGRPHAVLYRSDINRIYITDGGEGEVKIYNEAATAFYKELSCSPTRIRSATIQLLSIFTWITEVVTFTKPTPC